MNEEFFEFRHDYDNRTIERIHVMLKDGKRIETIVSTEAMPLPTEIFE
mgnify:FL=1